MKQDTFRHGHAIVIGASVAGLLAARVLSNHFERVTVIERDLLDEDAEPRRGVPQGRHTHLLLTRGEQVMSGLFPDLVPDLLARGATAITLGRELRWYHFGVWKKSHNGTPTSISVSRPCLEHELRRRVRNIRNVAIADGTVVTRYVADWERARITGVCVRGRHGDMLEDEVHADLVVDAGGRGSQTPQRLLELGYRKPEETALRIGFGYASREYQRPPGARPWQSMYVLDNPPSRRGGLIFPIEGDRWMVTLFGAYGDHPPPDDAGFMKFVRSLPVPDMHEALSAARPVAEVATIGFPTSQRRYYERLTRFPSGLLVMGDALCSFNPIFGQGMTVSALEAQLLDECLRSLELRGTPNLEALTCNFREQVSKTVDIAWNMATNEDLRFPQTPGARSLKVRFMHWYTKRLHRAAGESSLITERFHEVVHMLAPRSALFRRDVLKELLRVAFQTPVAPAQHHEHSKSEAHQHQRIERAASTTATT
jgi:2-polyprenyl-6-methoxyphenol hydroxylase-like FAD-dependent oxidoreductase